jgi:hypothetical protein
VHIQGLVQLVGKEFRFLLLLEQLFLQRGNEDGIGVGPAAQERFDDRLERLGDYEAPLQHF